MLCFKTQEVLIDARYIYFNAKFQLIRTLDTKKILVFFMKKNAVFDWEEVLMTAI